MPFDRARPNEQLRVDDDPGNLSCGGALDRGKQLAVVEQLTRIAADAADPGWSTTIYS